MNAHLQVDTIDPDEDSEDGKAIEDDNALKNLKMSNDQFQTNEKQQQKN